MNVAEYWTEGISSVQMTLNTASLVVFLPLLEFLMQKKRVLSGYQQRRMESRGSCLKPLLSII